MTTYQHDRDVVAGRLTVTAWRSNTARAAGHVELGVVADTIGEAREVGLDEDEIRRAIRLGQELAFNDQGIRLDEEIAIREAGEVADFVADADACGPFDPLRVRTFANESRWRLFCRRHADHTEGLHLTEWRPAEGVAVPAEFADEAEREVEVKT